MECLTLAECNPPFFWFSCGVMIGGLIVFFVMLNLIGDDKNGSS